MELNGYYFDKKRNRYFKKSSLLKFDPDSTNNDVKINSFRKKFLSTINALADIQTNGTRNQSSYSKLSSLDSVLASRFNSRIFKHRNNSKFEIDPFSFRISNPYCVHLAPLPEKNLIFGVWATLEKKYLFRLNIKNSLKPDFPPVYIDFSNILTFSLENCVTNQIIPKCSGDIVSLFELRTTFKSESSIYSFNFDYENTGEEFFSLDYTSNDTLLDNFCSSFDIKDNNAVFGGEKYVYNYGFSNHINAFKKLSEVKVSKKALVTAVKIGNCKKYAFCGLSSGFLDCVDLVNNQKTHRFKLCNNKIVDLQLVDDNSIIFSAHNNNLFQIDLRYYKRNKYLMKFEEHVNNCKNIKFSIDSVFNTLTCCGQDKTVRIWSLSTGRLIRYIPFNEVCHRVKHCKFDKIPLLSKNSNQLFNDQDVCGNKIRYLSQKKHSPYYVPANDNIYQIISSSKWNFLNKQPKTLAIGSIADSLDFYY